MSLEKIFVKQELKEILHELQDIRKRLKNILPYFDNQRKLTLRTVLQLLYDAEESLDEFLSGSI